MKNVCAMDRSSRKTRPIDYQEIVEELKPGMRSLNPGQRLVELQLCKRFGVKRNKIRQALQQLEQEGFVKIIPHVGAMVAELSQKDIEQTYDLLGAVEGLAARVAISSFTDRHLEHVGGLIEKMETAEEPSLFFDYNKEFHSYLTSLSENDRLIRFADNLRNHIRAFYFRLRDIDQPRVQFAHKEHRKIVEAIEQMKPLKVEQLIRAHYLHSKGIFTKHMNKSL